MPAKRKRSTAGFTLIELIVVVTIIGILAGIAVVNVRYAQRKARETVLKHDLAAFRKAIDDFYADKQKYPASLNDLVTEHYMRSLPKNPITGSAEDWEPVMQDPTDQGATADPNPDQTSSPGIIDVKSGPNAAGETMDDHTPYADL